MSGLRIETFYTENGDVTRFSYLKVNEYEVYAQMLHPVGAMEVAILLKTLSDKIREKEALSHEHK